MFRSLLAVAALALAFVSMPSSAQVWPPGLTLPTPALAELAHLQLSPAQRMELLQILVRARALQSQIRADQEALLADATLELGDESPDLRALAAAQEVITDQRILAIRALRDELLDFHESLSPAQQAEVQAWLLRQIGRIEQAKSAIALLRDLLANH
jgi:uncharacterized membrane protein